MPLFSTTDIEICINELTDIEICINELTDIEICINELTVILKFVSMNWLWYWNLYQWTDSDIEICINELTLILKFVSMNWLILKFVGQCDVKRIMTLLIKTITSSWKVWRTLLSYRAYCDTSDYVCLDLWISSYSIFINIWDTSPSDLSSIWTLVSSIAFPKLNPLRQFWQKHFHWLI